MVRERYLEDRYKKRLRAAIEKKLPSIVANEQILENPQDKIKVRIPILDEPYFKPNSPSDGQGGKGGNGKIPGEEHGDYEVEIELSIEELAELLFEYLSLPRLKPRPSNDDFEEIRIQGISKTGPRSRLHRKKTTIEVLKRNLLTDSALRYRDIRKDISPIIKADVFLMRDFSASMDEQKRFKVRSIAFWILEFLKRNYPFVNLHFILHDTEAFFTNEQEFFQAKTGGGTKVSSAFALAMNKIAEIGEDTNYYLFYFSDGENIESDNPEVIRLVEGLAKVANLIGYAEIQPSTDYLNYGYYNFLLSKHLVSLKQDRGIDNLKVSVTLSVRKTLMDFFGEAIDE